MRDFNSYKENQDEQYNITNVTLFLIMVDKQMLYKEKQVSNVTLACDDDWQLEAHKMRKQVYHTKKTKMINITNVTLASDDNWQREAHKVRQQIY